MFTPGIISHALFLWIKNDAIGGYWFPGSTSADRFRGLYGVTQMDGYDTLHS